MTPLIYIVEFNIVMHEIVFFLVVYGSDFEVLWVIVVICQFLGGHGHFGRSSIIHC